MNEIDAYIEKFPPETQEKLKQLRTLILETVPGVEEYIGYQMPAYKFKGSLVYFAGYKKHIGFYPHGSGISNFTNELSRYKYSKGAIQFPLDKKLPVGLIKKILKFRAKENTSKAT